MLSRVGAAPGDRRAGMRRCDAPSQRKAGGGPGFHALHPLPATPDAASAASAAPAHAASSVPADSGAGAKPVSRFRPLHPAARPAAPAATGAGVPQRKPFAVPRLIAAPPPAARQPEADARCGESASASPSGVPREERHQVASGNAAQTGDGDAAQAPAATPAPRPGFAPPQRKVFAMAVHTPTAAARPDPDAPLDEPVYVEVFFTKFSKKKKKVWEDGVLVLKQGCMELQVLPLHPRACCLQHVPCRAPPSRGPAS